MLRDPASGTFERVTDESRILAALNSDDDGSHYYVFTKDPSVQSFTDLMNRTLDKPKEQEQEVAPTGRMTIFWQAGVATASTGPEVLGDQGRSAGERRGRSTFRLTPLPEPQPCRTHADGFCSTPSRCNV